jgi:hypothetical protein
MGESIICKTPYLRDNGYKNVSPARILHAARDTNNMEKGGGNKTFDIQKKVLLGASFCS